MKQEQTTKEAAMELAKEVFVTKTKQGDLSNMIAPDDRPLWEQYPDLFLNPYQQLSPLQTWAIIGDRPALPKEGIVTFQAKQKKGKSLSVYALALALLSGKDFDTMKPQGVPNLILIFDLEMSQTTLTNRVRTQIESIGKNGTRFVVCPMKGKSVEESREFIPKMLSKFNPAVAVIDQGGKLCYDENDSKESKAVVKAIDQWSIGRAVWVVMHENKGDDNKNMKGHFGSQLSYAAVEAYSVDRKDGVFTITPKEARDTDTEDAACIRFALDSDGRIIDASDIYRRAVNEEVERWRKNFLMIFGEDKTLRSADLIARIMQVDNLEERAAKTKMAKARDLGVIRKTSADHRAPYELTPVAE